MVKVKPISTISSRVDNKLTKVKKIHVQPIPVKKKTVVRDSWLMRCFKEFAQNTALHGYNHIVRADTSKWER